MEITDNIDEVSDVHHEDKNVCSVKTGMNDLLDYMGIIVTIVIPTLLGPLMLMIITPLCYWCHGGQSRSGSRSSSRSGTSDKDDSPTTSFILILSAVFLACYSLNMVISELYIVDGFLFVIIKESFIGSNVNFPHSVVFNFKFTLKQNIFKNVKIKLLTLRRIQ